MSNNNNNNNKKESISDRFSKILEEEENKKKNQQESNENIKDIVNYNSYDLEQLEKRRLYLEREITDINKALANKTAPPPNEVDPWYKDYPLIYNTVNDKDFKILTTQISIMSFLGLIMGGAHGYSLGKNKLRESIAKSAHNPLSINSTHLNLKRTYGLLVVRNAFVLSYRCALYTAVYGGVETILKRNLGDSIINPIAGGTAVGILAGFHLRKRGNLAIPLLMIVGSTVGGIVGVGDQLNKKFFFPNETESKTESVN